MLRVNMTHFIFAVLAPLLFVACAGKKIDKNPFKVYNVADSNYNECVDCHAILPQCKEEKIAL